MVTFNLCVPFVGRRVCSNCPRTCPGRNFRPSATIVCYVRCFGAWSVCQDGKRWPFEGHPEDVDLAEPPDAAGVRGLAGNLNSPRLIKSVRFPKRWPPLFVVHFRSTRPPMLRKVSAEFRGHRVTPGKHFPSVDAPSPPMEQRFPPCGNCRPQDIMLADCPVVALLAKRRWSSRRWLHITALTASRFV